MNKRQIIFLIILMSLALIGIVFVQFFWISNALKLKEEQFDSTTRKVMADVIKKVNKKETLFFVWQQDDISENIIKKMLVVNDSNSDIKLIKEENNKIIEINQHIDTSKTDKKKYKYTFNIKKKEYNTDTEVFEFNNSKSLKQDSFDFKVLIDSNVKRIKNVISDVAIEITSNEMPIQKRLEISSFDSILDVSLKNEGINSEYNYAISDSKKDSIVYGNEELDNFTGKNSLFEFLLFPENLISPSYKLLINFPQKRFYVLKSLKYILFVSLLFTIILIIIFVVSISIILRQKKVSEIKSDFINNMTHEFKTPIATISLSIDSIMNPKVIEKKEKIIYFGEKIKQENKRMNNLVEKVLQISLMDQKDFILHLELMDIHELIQNAIDGFILHIDEKKGELNTNYLAQNSFVRIDSVHLLNVIYNLIDNAIKYSGTNPEIMIRTINVDDNVEISVIDKGIGLSKEEMKNVFEKFYRVQSGNIHNVKGFGLGLSYVKQIVEMHGGSVFVESEKKKETRFSIIIPIAKN